MPIDPTAATGLQGLDWQIQKPAADPDFTVGALDGDGVAAASGSGSGFGAVLAGQLGSLAQTQNAAAEAARALATGQAADPSAAVVAIDRARLAMQLAATIRTKGVEAFQDLMRTQI